VYCINGVEDHIHIISDIHPAVSLASVVKDIKLASSSLIKSENLFEGFGGWQAGYGAFTYSLEAKQNLIAYVKNQEEHHRKVTYVDEYIKMLHEHGVEFDERYLL
jgi:REP element-mobilizing transposase RayT